uniref:Uncharacterized protein n=1 Tax=Candidatus Kentrum sp. FW TaxID=2126338 RepID=A0A450TVM6_9GAMM|nr:MAG: hypothetical protein BECKFW1821C_GA0114237_104112 [Candidatus Kentron sp. FW]
MKAFRLDAKEGEKTSGMSLSDGRDELGLTPRMREDIDRRLAIAQEEIRNGQYVRLDNEFMEKFLEEAYRRNTGIIGSGNLADPHNTTSRTTMAATG